MGEVAAVDPIPGGVRFRTKVPLAGEMATGDSLAVNGVCLTVVAQTRDEVHFDVSPQTLKVTSLGVLKPASLVNLERPMRADGRMGGHFVLGHVDATGTIREIRTEGEFYWFRIGFPLSQAAYVIPKGSIAVDGISLTVAELREDDFDVQIIPYTWDCTNLRALRVGDPVNLEFDVVGKYVVRIAELAGVRVSGQDR